MKKGFFQLSIALLFMTIFSFSNIVARSSVEAVDVRSTNVQHSMWGVGKTTPNMVNNWIVVSELRVNDVNWDKKIAQYGQAGVDLVPVDADTMVGKSLKGYLSRGVEYLSEALGASGLSGSFGEFSSEFGGLISYKQLAFVLSPSLMKGSLNQVKTLNDLYAYAQKNPDMMRRGSAFEAFMKLYHPTDFEQIMGRSIEGAAQTLMFTNPFFDKSKKSDKRNWRGQKMITCLADKNFFWNYLIGTLSHGIYANPKVRNLRFFNRTSAAFLAVIDQNRLDDVRIGVDIKQLRKTFQTLYSSAQHNNMLDSIDVFGGNKGNFKNTREELTNIRRELANKSIRKYSLRVMGAQ